MAQRAADTFPMKNSVEHWLPKVVVAPAFVLGFAFIYGLMIWNGVLSLSVSRMLPNYEWAGLEQYARLWEMDRWWVALKNLAVFGVGYVGGSLVVGVILAVLLDQKIRAEGALRTIYLYPFRFDWLVDPDMAIYTVVIAGVWQSAGFVMALFLAGLRGVDESIIKAAQIDGASLPRIYVRIIIPSLRPVFFSTLMVLAHIAIKSFDLVMALTAGGPGYATDVPATFMYAMSFSRGQIGLGAASAMMMLATVAALVVPYLYSELRRRPHDR